MISVYSDVITVLNNACCLKSGQNKKIALSRRLREKETVLLRMIHAEAVKSALTINNSLRGQNDKRTDICPDQNTPTRTEFNWEKGFALNKSSRSTLETMDDRGWDHLYEATDWLWNRSLCVYGLYKWLCLIHFKIKYLRSICDLKKQYKMCCNCNAFVYVARVKVRTDLGIIVNVAAHSI